MTRTQERATLQFSRRQHLGPRYRGPTWVNVTIGLIFTIEVVCGHLLGLERVKNRRNWSARDDAGPFSSLTLPSVITQLPRLSALQSEVGTEIDRAYR